jgi:HK97 gp10 family phage protein
MMRVGMKIIGLQSHMRKLAAMPTSVRVAAAADIQHQTTEMAAVAVALAPNDKGDLDKGIKPKAVEVAGDRVEGGVVSIAPHSIHVEYGTSEQSPQPFLRPATLTGGTDRIARLGKIVKHAAEGA